MQGEKFEFKVDMESPLCVVGRMNGPHPGVFLPAWTLEILRQAIEGPARHALPATPDGQRHVPQDLVDLVNEILLQQEQASACVPSVTQGIGALFHRAMRKKFA